MMKKSDLYIFAILIIVCVLKLVQIGYSRINFSTDILLNSFKKNYGEHIALKKDIIEAKKLLIENEITNFNLSEELMSNGYFKQRIVEFSYPIRLNETSKAVISLRNKSNKCKLKSKLNDLKLYEC